MARFIVIKRIINDYEVVIEAKDAANAIEQAAANNHEPGDLTSEFNDGDTFYPSSWLVLESEQRKEITDIKRESLTRLDR